MKNYSNFMFYSVNAEDDTPSNLAKFLAENLPHGSGIDYDWFLEYTDDSFEKEEHVFIIARNNYHAMDEYGGYCHIWPFEVSIPVREGKIDLSNGLEIFVNGDDCEFCYCDDDYLYEVIYWSLKDAQNG